MKTVNFSRKATTAETEIFYAVEKAIDKVIGDDDEMYSDLLDCVLTDENKLKEFAEKLGVSNEDLTLWYFMSEEE